MRPPPDWEAVHLRMLATLPKRIHHAPESVGDLNWRRWRKGRGKQAVMIDGTKYDSLTKAAEALGTNRPAILKMIERGEASYGAP